ncbi:MAG: PASTA domain-containing protein, partial [Gemmatimonadota bacterium]
SGASAPEATGETAPPARGGGSAGRSADADDRGRIWALGLSVLLLATLGAFALGRKAAEFVLLPATLTRQASPEAPDLVGESLADARERARDAGTALDVLGLAYGSEVDSGEVLVQYPPEGMLLQPGKPVEVLVGAGPGVRRVPDLRGLPETAARSLLEAAALLPARRSRIAEGGSETGAVAATDPPPGAVLAEGDSVVLAVSRGGAVIEVPDVIGKTVGEAAEALRAAGLGVRSATRVEDRDPAQDDVVLAQDPPAGGLARTGTGVSLRMGRGGTAPRPPAGGAGAAGDEDPADAPVAGERGRPD